MLGQFYGRYSPGHASDQGSAGEWWWDPSLRKFGQTSDFSTGLRRPWYDGHKREVSTKPQEAEWWCEWAISHVVETKVVL